MSRRRTLPLFLLAPALGAAAWLLLRPQHDDATPAASVRAEQPDMRAAAALEGRVEPDIALATARRQGKAGPRGALTIRGRVWLGDDQPAAGAEVHAEADGPARGHDSRTLTSADGRYVLTGLGHGLHRVTATLYAGAQVRSAEGLARAGVEGFDLLLARQPDRLDVRVLDAQGAPVPWVRLRGRDARQVHDLGTAQDGRTRLEIGPARFGPGMSEVEGSVLEAYDPRDAQGHGLALAPCRVGPLLRGQEHVELRLEPGALVQALVIAPPGVALSGVRFQIMLAEALPPGDAPPGRITSDPPAFDGALLTGEVPDDGRLRLAALDPAAEHTLLLTVPEGLINPGPSRLTPGAPPTDVTLRAALDVTIRVEGPDGRRLVGVEVGATPEGAGNVAPDSVPTRAGEAGASVLVGLDPERTYSLRVRAPEWADEGSRVPGTYAYEDLLPLVRSGWRPRDEVVRLQQGLSIAGVVLDHDGDPARAAALRFVRPAQGEAPAWEGWSSCDDSGTFALRGLPSGRYEIWAMAADAVDGDVATTRAARATVEAGRHAVVLRLGPSRRATLEFDPAQQAEVSGGYGLRVRRLAAGDWVSTGSYNGLAASARITVSCLRPDATYEFIQYTGPPGYWRAVLSPGADSARFRRELGGEIRVVVRDADTLEGLYVGVSCDSLHPWFGEEEQLSGGTYILRGLPPGEYAVMANGWNREGVPLRATVLARPGAAVTLSLVQDGDKRR